ncbi:4'-phosphopantetheinyl transferase superfamily protein [Tannerella sp.]|uniref:4'-phosphopantetheinyl transferase family protein n=1 Tax=Tannerella sp. TaxID=2382127 RepID=UPI0026DBC92E|nr:4'-phosphopantetheinyl transferase family protein [Tannerella sp.]MDO4702769.1 4'-phosphopantetheinyl transferase superfamily protein [Tannerella sp.]
MPVLPEYTTPQRGIWKIEESRDELLALLTRKDDYMPFLSRCKSDSRQTEWLAVRTLLKTMLGHETSIAYHPDGIPYLPDEELHISISHTKGYAAVLLGTQPRIGIDIEHRSERIRKLYERFLGESEQRLIGRQPDTETLLICWSAKETAFKMMRKRAVDWRNDLQIISFDAQHRQLSIRETLTPYATLCSIRYIATPEFIMTQSAPQESLGVVRNGI